MALNQKKEIIVMEMKPVTSSQVESVGFENGTLAVKFKSGGTYHYAGVPQHQYDSMMKSPSIGSYLHKNIKGRFAHKKVGM